jgi:hypothetical protein
MKLRFLILGLSLLSFFSQAQQAFGENATWHYDWHAFGPVGYQEVKHVGDTNMHGMTWLKFSITGASKLRTGPGPNDFVQDTARDWGFTYVATRNDSVFRLLNGSPYLLFRLNPNVGDSWQFAPLDTTAACMDTPIATVEAVGTEIINGSTVDYIDISMPMDSVYYGSTVNYQPSCGVYLPNRIYPAFGFLRAVSLFEAIPNLCDGSSFSLASHSLRCFQNQQISFNRTNRDCDYFSKIGLEELEVHTVKVYPQPSTGEIQIKSETPIVSLEIRDLKGRSIQSFAPTQSLKLDLKPGLYLLEIRFENGSSYMHKIQLI